jgi:hypothetical protein
MAGSATRWTAVGFHEGTGSFTGGAGAKVWMFLRDSGRVVVRENGTAGSVLFNGDAPVWHPLGSNLIELQYRRLGGQDQARALVNGIEVMTWRAVSFPGSVSRAGFQFFNGTDAAGLERSSRLDDFAIASLGDP